MWPQKLGVICSRRSLFVLCLRRINLKNKTIHTSCGEFQETPMPHRGTYIIFYYLRYLRTICRSRNNVWFLKSEDNKYYWAFQLVWYQNENNLENNLSNMRNVLDIHIIYIYIMCRYRFAIRLKARELRKDWLLLFKYQWKQ